LLGCESLLIDNMNINTNKGLKEIPVLSWRECFHFDLLDYTKIQNKILTEKQVTGKGYSLIVEDNDLVTFPENSLLIVEPSLEPNPGDYIIVAKSEHGIASIKKYITETDQIYLKSLIHGLAITPLTSEHKILGVIIQYKVDLKREI